MSKKRFLPLLIVGVTLVLLFLPQKPATEALSRYGSQGDEVISIQSKLLELGYYTGQVDGIFGPLTQSAVIRYQKDYGLTADGIAGAKTMKSLGLSSGGISSSELELLARCVNAEARGEPYQGQVAVAAVVLNRVKSPSFPGTVSGVVYQPGAFSSVNDGQIDLEPSASCRSAAQDAANGVDPTYGSIYFYNPSKTSNAWIRSRPVVTTIGGHVFAK